MKLVNAIQVYEVFTAQADAVRCFETMVQQEGYLGGRILKPSPGKPGWKSQTFHDAEGINADSWLPDGCRYVMVPDWLLR